MRTVRTVHLRPTNRADGAWFGDPVPFYHDGVYHLFYVWDQGHLMLPRIRHRWGHFTSRDLVHWQEHPMAIEPGHEQSEEVSCGTGSVFQAGGAFHMYYLGRYVSEDGTMHETLCHATSADLIRWQKDPRNPISRPEPGRYLLSDWRDGYPLWNAEAGEYWMLVTAALAGAPEPLGGCLALLASPDLERWEIRDPFWAPCLGPELECPDLFHWNGWWYLLVSGVFGLNRGTIYRRSRSLLGPWQPAPVETFDGDSLYACKTAGDGRRRMLFGWIGTREGDRDTGRMQWGGHGTVRELIQDPDGTLWVRFPPERLALGEPLPHPAFEARFGRWAFGDRSASAASSSFAVATTAVPPNFLARFRFRPDGNPAAFGLLLRTDPDLGRGYRLSIEPGRDRFGVASFGPRGQGRPRPLERPMVHRPGEPTEVTLLFSGSIVEVFVNERTALSARLYDHQGSYLGLFVQEGAGEFTEIDLRALPQETW